VPSKVGSRRLRLRATGGIQLHLAPSPTPTSVESNRAKKPVRRPLPAHLPREVRKILPKQEACPDCGGELKHLGEAVSEMLEYVVEHFKVIQKVRPKLACACCDKIVLLRHSCIPSAI
jgi:transposase